MKTNMYFILVFVAILCNLFIIYKYIGLERELRANKAIIKGYREYTKAKGLSIDSLKTIRDEIDTTVYIIDRDSLERIFATRFGED